MIRQNKCGGLRGYRKWTIIISLIFLVTCIHYYANFGIASPDPCLQLKTLQQDDPSLISCLKKGYLVPPNARPYNLLDPAVKNPTQFGQNLLALSLLRNMKDGFFVECGALDGENLSNTLLLERDYGWTGLLVEADPSNYQTLESKHRRAWISHSCLSPTTKAEKLTLVGITYGKLGGLTLVNDSVPLKDIVGSNSGRIPAEVQCFPFYTYLLALDRTVVDYLSLDVEGADFEILKTIPFDKVIFKVLEVEARWVKEGMLAVREFLEGHGYVFIKEVAVDYIFVHNSVNLTGTGQNGSPKLG